MFNIIDLVNLEAECSVLQTIVQTNELYLRSSDKLESECFYHDETKKVFEFIVDKISSEGSVSEYEVVSRFQDVEYEGEKLIGKVLGHRSLAMMFPKHVSLLCDLRDKRKLRELVSGLDDSIYEKDAIEIASDIASKAAAIISHTPQNNTVSIQKAFEGIYNQINDPIPPARSATGLPLLDEAMAGGFWRGRVYSFAAKAKIGKTLLAATVSNNLCDNGHKHLFVCAEMGSEEVAMRMLGQRLNLPSKAFRERKDDTLKQQVAEQVTRIQNNVIFENEAGIEFDRLKLVVEKHVHRTGIEGFILDYYQLVGGRKARESQAEHLEAVANWIHRVCKKHNIWCMLLVQANDEGLVLGSRGLDRACDQKYQIERPLDNQGDPIGKNVWFKHKLSRYTALYDLGADNNPTHEISPHGTHIQPY